MKISESVMIPNSLFLSFINIFLSGLIAIFSNASFRLKSESSQIIILSFPSGISLSTSSYRSKTNLEIGSLNYFK